MLDPINVPQRVGLEEQQVLNSIDGQRDIETILGQFGAAESEKLRMFLVRRLSHRLSRLQPFILLKTTTETITESILTDLTVGR